MNKEIQGAIEDLTIWRSSYVPVLPAERTNVTGQPCIEAFGTTAPIIRFRELTKASDFDLQCRASMEPEYIAAAEALYNAIRRLHDAREAIIDRKARELASLIHGDQTAGIQKLVSEIQGGERAPEVAG